MLNNRNKLILQAELNKNIYDNLSLQEAYDYLFLDYIINEEKLYIPPMLTPRFVAAEIGPVKAEAIAFAMKTAFPTIADSLLSVGVDPSSPVTQMFLNSLLVNNILTQDELNKLLPRNIITPVSHKMRAMKVFSGTSLNNLINIANVGQLSSDEEGFPNYINISDFTDSWNLIRG